MKKKIKLLLVGLYDDIEFKKYLHQKNILYYELDFREDPNIFFSNLLNKKKCLKIAAI